MNYSLILDNLLAWSAQLLVLAAAGALAAWTLKHPRGRLVFWQGLLAISLLLPMVEPWTQQPGAPDSGVTAETSAPAIVTTPVAHSSFHWKPADTLAVLGVGAVLRMLWIAAGLVRLRSHRVSARRVSHPRVPFRVPRVRWYRSDTISGPVTFGWLRPAILLPSRLDHLPAEVSEAVAVHELVHVGRRDWLFVLAEELIRGVLWFHPAIWFILSRIQLAREQVVDLEVVRLTGDRTRYLEALVAVAAQKLVPDVAPAPLFLKKRQLAVRVAAVLKEIPMSKSRLAASFATVCSAAMIAIRLAIWLFPLQSPAQSLPESHGFLVADGAGITIDSGGTLLHRPPVFYPGGATATGTVALEANLNSQGEVTDAHVLSGPDELRRAALQSVLQWHYSTASPPQMVRVSITFGQAPSVIPKGARMTASPRADTIEALALKFDLSRLSPELAQRVADRLPFHDGDRVTATTRQSIVAALMEIDEHLIASFGLASSTGNSAAFKPDELNVRITVLDQQIPALPPAVSSAAPAGVSGATPGSQGPIRVGGAVQSANLIRKVTPDYPSLAKQARIQGHVVFNATIGADGSIQFLELVSGHPLLVPAATEAVKQWAYRPTLLNGQPVVVLTQIDVNFTLLGEPPPPAN